MITAALITFMFCGVNEGYQGNLVKISDPNEAVKIVKKTILQKGDFVNYEIYPGKVIYPKEYGCPDGGEVIAATIIHGDPGIAVQVGEYLRSSLLQTSLSVATYNGYPNMGYLTRGFTAEVYGYPIDTIAVEWQRQAEKNKSSVMYATAGFYTKKKGVVIIQAEANPKKSHLDSKEKIQIWEKMAILVAAETAKILKVDINLEFQDVYFNYLRK